MIKKLLLTLLVVTLSVTAGVAGTLAYLQDEDSDVNVMTVGNVHIKQHEYERATDANGNYTTIDVDGIKSYELQEFTQGKPLYPFVGEVNNGYDSTPVRLGQLGHNSRGGMNVFPAKNVQDKFVVVENTGSSDAYVRTIVAFEAGSLAEEEWYKVIKYSSHLTWKETQDWFVTEINGNNYYFVEFVYEGANGVQHSNGVLPPGDYTFNSLAQVYMFDTATNEDVEALDGNKNGTFDILVLSQAVQTEGFENAKTALDAAFGAFNETNAVAWFTGMENDIPAVISEYYDYFDYVYDSGNYVIGDDFVADDYIFYAPGTTVGLDLNGKEITAGNRGQYLFIAQGGSKLSFDGNGTVDAGKGFFASTGGAEITVNEGTYYFDQTGKLDNILHHSLAQNEAKIVINGGTFVSSIENAAIFFATSNAVIEVNGGYFDNTADETPDYFSMGTNKHNTNRIIFTGGTFVNWNPMEDRMMYKGEWPANGYDAFSGPWMLLADGYKVVSETQPNGDVWYTVVAK